MKIILERLLNYFEWTIQFLLANLIWILTMPYIAIRDYGVYDVIISIGKNIYNNDEAQIINAEYWLYLNGEEPINLVMKDIEKLKELSGKPFNGIYIPTKNIIDWFKQFYYLNEKIETDSERMLKSTLEEQLPINKVYLVCHSKAALVLNNTIERIIKDKKVNLSNLNVLIFGNVSDDITNYSNYLGSLKLITNEFDFVGIHGDPKKVIIIKNKYGHNIISDYLIPFASNPANISSDNKIKFFD
jgi:hypothetical protein